MTTTKKRTFIRKIPGAAKKMLSKRSHEYTAKEWADALGVTRSAISKLCIDNGWTLRLDEAEKARRVEQLRGDIAEAVIRDPDPMPSRTKKRHLRQVVNNHRRSSALSEAPGTSAAALALARRKF